MQIDEKLGIYIHIPFCKKKCYYCDFISYAGKEDKIEEYIEAIKKEIIYKLKKISKNISTIYIGGGTPSFIDSKYIVDILNVVKQNCFVKHDAEITIEINPGTITEEKLKNYLKAGINRLSIGLQETDNEVLKEIGRIHTLEEFLKNYELARKVGFKNINVDLMIGLPNQTMKNVEKSLEKIIDLKPEHISIYSLILEEGTVLYNQFISNELKLPDEQLERKMYWKVKNTLEKNEYIHYEISNFSKKGYKSKHNEDCWNQEEYLGFGAAAHSYMDKERFSNIESIEEYVLNIQNEDYIKNIIINERQTEESIKKEYMILGLRKIEGVSIQKFKQKFGENPIFIFKDELNKLSKNKLIQVDGDKIALTKKGLDLANLVWEEFI